MKHSLTSSSRKYRHSSNSPRRRSDSPPSPDKRPPVRQRTPLGHSPASLQNAVNAPTDLFLPSPSPPLLQQQNHPTHYHDAHGRRIRRPITDSGSSESKLNHPRHSPEPIRHETQVSNLSLTPSSSAQPTLPTASGGQSKSSSPRRGGDTIVQYKQQ